MLYGLESFLRAAIDPALPGGVTGFSGPWTAAQGDGVYVHAHSLSLEPLGEDPPEDAPGHLLTIHEWAADGSTLDFEIPPQLTGELLDVEAPPGFPAARGDLVYLDDRTLRFYRPPTLGDPAVRARLKGDPGKGYRRRRPCTIGLELRAVDATLADVDAQLELALHVSLSSLLELPILEAGEVAGAQVWMRVHRIRSAIESITRGVFDDGGSYWAGARLELRGELDLLVVRGAPDPVGVIAEVAGAIEVNAVTRSFVIHDPAQPAPSPGDRAIEGQSVSLIAGLGTTTSNELAALSEPIATLVELAALDIDDPAIAGQLGSPATVRGHVRRAQLILAALSAGTGLPAMPPAADAETLSDLLALSLGDLAALIELGLGYAAQLRDELLTLEILLEASALSTLTLADFR